MPEPAAEFGPGIVGITLRRDDGGNGRGSSTAPHAIRRRLPGSLKPYLRRRTARPQALHRRIIIFIELEVAGPKIDGDELAVVLRPKPRPDMASEGVRPQLGNLFPAELRFGVRHRRFVAGF